MISRRPPRSALLAAVLGVWLTSGVAIAQCTYTGLTSGVSITTGTVDSDLQFSEGQPYWSVLGIRPNASTADWDAYVYSSAVAYPFCLSGLLASSTQGVGVADVVVGDFNSNPTGTYYVQAHHFSSDNVTSTVEWVAGSQIMRVNGPLSFNPRGGSEVARIYDVFLNQGQAYLHASVVRELEAAALSQPRQRALLDGTRRRSVHARLVERGPRLHGACVGLVRAGARQ
jgi:hypothetical protein